MYPEVCSHWKMGNIKQLVVSFSWKKPESTLFSHAPLIPSRILGVLRPVSSSLNLQIFEPLKKLKTGSGVKKKHEDSQNGIFW